MDCPLSSAAPETPVAIGRSWPAGGFTSAPYWVYDDPAVYAREQQAIFRGRSWHYLGLEAEVPEPGSYKNTYIGDSNVLLTRAEDGSLNAMLNRCAHRGNMVCREAFGKVQKLHCVYHSWNYNLKGDLTFVAFRNGLRGEGGLPKDFDMAQHGLRKLRVASFCGLVFATFADDTPPLEEWLGDVADGIRRVCRKPLKVLGYDTQRIHANWKAYHENPRDSYHANILHTFYGTFGLSRQSQESGMVLDATVRGSDPRAVLVDERVEGGVGVVHPLLLLGARRVEGAAVVGEQEDVPGHETRSSGRTVRRISTPSPSAAMILQHSARSSRSSVSTR